MYQVSDAFRTILDGSNRSIEWRGTISLTNGATYKFDASNIVQGSASLSSSCGIPGIGGAFSTELQIKLFIDINISLLENAIIGLYSRVRGNDVRTWQDAEVYTWEDISSAKWGTVSKQVFLDIPMGQFRVSKAERDINSIKIMAHDFMVDFDVDLAAMDTVPRTPFAWLRLICSKCGITFGMTNAQVKNLPNAGRTFTYADINSDVKTYRDLLSQLSMVLGSIAMMDRWGELILLQYKNQPVASLTPDNRYSSVVKDYSSVYTGIYAQYKAKGVQEYFRNVDALNDNGAILDAGVNVFLQISNDANRETAVKAIIDFLTNKTFTPFDVSMPFDPTFDLLDTVNLTGGHVPANSRAPITYIYQQYNGAMTLKCTNPESTTNPIRENKEIDGISGNSSVNPGTVYANNDFWLLIASFPDEATQIADSDTITTELTLDCSVDNTCIQIAWTGAYTLDEDATVTAKVLIDNESIYEVSDDQKAGSHVLNVTTGHTLTQKGSYKVKVILREDEIT